MIRLTRLNQHPVVVNSELIETVEATPDTVISLTTGQKLLVRETPEEIIARVIAFRREVLAGMPAYAAPARNQTPSPPLELPVRLVRDGE